jgi:glycogen debranching enzyme
LLEDPRGRAEARRFLAAGGHGEALVRNLLFVADSSAAFADRPVYSNLVALKPDKPVGQWRDSNEGIGRGRYPYDVNAVWMPAALRAIGGFLQSGLLEAYTTAEQRARLLASAARADTWESKAGALFTVRLPQPRAVAQVRGYAAQIGVADGPALAALGKNALAFPAISLDAQGEPVPVLHSDEGFRLLFGKPDAAALGRDVDTLMRPFPAGLMTDAGLLVANPAYADKEIQPRFDRNAYHGTVVWAWQQAIMAAGLQRQLARDDLPSATRARLSKAQVRLWQVIRAADAVRTSELWSWSYAEGQYRVEPFGAQGAHEDESNAAQLWSTVFLALTPPASFPPSEPGKESSR